MQSFSASGAIDPREGSGRGGASQLFDSASFLPNRAVRVSLVGGSRVNLVNDISFSQEPGLAPTQFKADRNAPSAGEEK